MGPASDVEAELALFGRSIGQWHVHNSLFSEVIGQWMRSELLWTFAWIIEGRGIQDVPQ